MSGVVEVSKRLVRFPTVSSESNLDLISYVQDVLEGFGADSRLFPDEDGGKANLWVTLGPADKPGVVLSGHTDVVPVTGQNWSRDPFQPWTRQGRLYGRGSADMKGFIACILVALESIDLDRLRRPLHMALSYDEEVGCAGVRSLVDYLAALEIKPALCVVGEPTSMVVVTAHKGIRLLETRVNGLAGHSSAPEKGVNAIVTAANLIAAIDAMAAEARARDQQDDRFEPPWTTFNIGRISGGSAVNIIAGEAVFEWEFRPVPGYDGDRAIARIQEFAEEMILPALRRTAPGAAIEFHQTASAPALDGTANQDAASFVLALLKSNQTGTVSFATEAGHFQTTAGIPTVVCGPGSIEQAHKADEFIEIDQLNQGVKFVADILTSLMED